MRLLKLQIILNKCVLRSFYYAIRMKVTPTEIMEGLIFPIEAYNRPGSRKLINAIKNDDLETVKKLITWDKYLLHIHVILTTPQLYSVA